MTQATGADGDRVGGSAYKELERALLRRIAGSMPAGERAAVAGLASPPQSDASDDDDQSRCLTLSARAVVQAQRSQLPTAAQIKMFLYRYNMAPAGLVWRREFAAPAQVREYLLATERADRRDYATNVHEDVPTQGWWYWQRNGRSPVDSAGVTHKLYISPTCEMTGLAFRLTRETLFDHEVASFKVGCSALGLLRTDKLVAYFERLDDLLAVAETLGRQLQGVSAQGVPFTIPLGTDGLLSRGLDPPKPKAVGQPWSWRALITARLAKWLHESGLCGTEDREAPSRSEPATNDRSIDAYFSA